jgi:Peptidase family M23
MIPTPSHPAITTPYGKAGSWSGGVHGGADFGSSGIGGADVVAPWSGTVTSASWGSAYGTQVVIDFDQLPDGSPGLWGVLAHLKDKNVSAGQRVAAGQLIGHVNSSGNSTGHHLHFEVQRAAAWQSGNHVNPQPWINAGDSAPPPSGDQWASGDVHQAKLVPGQMDSDSVRRLQRVLNEWSFVGGQELPITGNYLDQTQAEVAKFQEQICGDPPDGAIGPKQTDLLFEKLGPWNIIR